MKTVSKSVVLVCMLAGFLGGALVNAIANASAIKTWTTQDVVLSSDLNTNFQHIHNNMVGNHGARLVNADVNALAAIAHAKLATPALVAKAWAATTSVCHGQDAADSTTCVIQSSSQVCSIKSSGTAGLYRVRLSYVPANANYGVQASSLTPNVFCTANDATLAVGATCGAASTIMFTVDCRTNGGAATNADIMFTVWDNNS